MTDVIDGAIEAAMVKFNEDPPDWSIRIRVWDACWAYHRHMISATPGLRVHEADGTIRLPVEADL